MKKLFLCLLSAAVLAGCEELPKNPTSVQLTASVPSKQQRLLLGDFNYFQSQNFTQVPDAVKKVLELKDVTPASLQAWLEDRVKYVVGEDYKLESGVTLMDRFWQYENPGVFPDVVRRKLGGRIPGLNPILESSFFPETSRVMTVMSNVGSVAYLIGKVEGSLFGMEIPGVGNLPAKSPRIGVIQVGEGLFAASLKGRDLEKEAAATRIFRLATLFHEARHSDGNGKSLVFAHEECPLGHDFAGYNACDNNLNGPYKVGGVMNKLLAKNCVACSPGDAEILRVFQADEESRVIWTAAGVRATSDESQLDGAMRETCEALQRIDPNIVPDMCEKYLKPAASPVAAPAADDSAGWWDARPEGMGLFRR
ncbi:MAG: hypothetical protein HUU37_02175 [Bdellovibrionales bacterium]|nr:hypothetical protein [Bdellovibrionales bacterium]